MTRARLSWLPAALLVLGTAAVLPGCKKEKLAGGTPVLRGNVRDLQAAPDAVHVATLVNAGPAAEKGAPRDIVTGALAVADVRKPATGEATLLGAGVTSLPGAVLFSPDSKWIAFLANWSFARGAGDLHIAPTDGGPARRLAGAVTFQAFSKDGALMALVSDGTLQVVPSAGGEARTIARGVAWAEFAPGGRQLLVRRSARFGGALLLHDLDSGATTAVARGISSFGFAPSGSEFAFGAAALLEPDAADPMDPLAKKKPDRADKPGLYLAGSGAAPRLVSEEGAAEFRFSPDGKRLAFLTPPQPGAVTGDLWVVEGSGQPRRVAQKVSQMRFGPDGTLAVLGAYDERNHLGTLGMMRPGGELVEVARSVKQFLFSAAGRYLLITQAQNVGGHGVIVLAVHPVAAPPDTKPRVIDTGVFGYSADATEKRLAYKARCQDEGRACTLYVTDLEGAAAPKQLEARVAGFDFTPDGDLVVVKSRRRKDSGKLDYTLGRITSQALATGEKNSFQALDDLVSGEFLLAGPDRKQVAYVVEDATRPGVYVLDPSKPLVAAP